MQRKKFERMEFSAIDIATFLEGEIIGDGNVKVNNVSKIETGKKGTLAFLANPKYENFIYNTEASIVLISKDLKLQKDVLPTLIKVDDAYQAFATLLEMYTHARQSVKLGLEQPCFVDDSAKYGDDVYIGAFAYVAKNVKIGTNVKVYPQVFIGKNVSVGDNTILFPGCKIYDDCVIGADCIIHAGAVIGSDGFGFAPQDDGSYKKIPQIGNVILEDNVEIGANTTIDCGTMESTIIRKGVKLDNLVQIAHNCEVGDNTVIAAHTGLAGTVKVGKNCMMGGQVGIAGHLEVGDNVQIGAQSGITKNIKGNQIILGSPAVPIKRAMKMYTIFRNLPELREEVIQLKKDIKQLKK